MRICGTGPKETKACGLEGFSIVVKDNHGSKYEIENLAFTSFFLFDFGALMHHLSSLV